MSTKIRTYSELSLLETFEERFDYLSMDGQVGDPTFGSDRWMNQQFYISSHWRNARRLAILRDNGCDLGIPGYDIHGELLVHHINQMTIEDILNGEEWIINPEYLITTTKETHNAIHYGDRSRLRRPYVERAPGDTKLWG